ncbi:MAG TPA: response regulator [Deltaproteobacteria bacterium]|nr:response regulator [Deltaproteobacteria bacterium]
MRKLRQSILAIDEDARTREAISTGLAGCGFTVYSAGGAGDGLKSLLSLRPDFVILNVSPLCRGWMNTLKDICEADPHARVITVSSCADDSYAIECIRHGAVDFLKKPIDINELTQSIERINHRRRMLEIISETDLECVKKEVKTLVFGNSTESLPYIINQAAFNAWAVCRNVDMLKTALSEIVLNAIEHGNLEISREEKTLAIEKGNYSELLRERMNDPRYASRTVTLQVHMSGNRLRYIVTDQGNGFDYERVLDSEPYTHIGSGLGLFIARSFFTSITFEGVGNRVVLVYRRPAGER